MTGFLGRFLDSAQTHDFQYPNRTLRADMIKIDALHDRIYMKAGGGYFFGYRFSTFWSDLGGPLVTGAHSETYLPSEMLVNPETDSAWVTTQSDGQERLKDFDFDKRGYVYLAYSEWGFGIVDLNGTLVKQVPYTGSNVYPVLACTFEDSGFPYLLVSDANTQTSIYSVNDPTAPQLVQSLGFGVKKCAKNDTGTTITLLPVSGSTLKFYTPSILLSNNFPFELPPSAAHTYADVTTDGTRFFAAQSGSDVILSTFTSGPGGYTKADQPPITGLVTDLTYRNGYLSFLGFSGSRKAVLYAINGTTWTANDISTYIGSSPYTVAGPNLSIPRQIVSLCTASGNVALLAFHGLGDAFTMSAGVAPCSPDAPTNIVAARGNASASVSFTPPANNGGAAIASYIVRSTPGNARAAGTTSPITVPGLVNGSSYTFTVTATNSAGATMSASSNAITTFGPPATFSATSNGTASVSLSWTTAPGAVQYEILRGLGAAVMSPLPGLQSGTTYEDTTVVPNTTYVYAVKSVDAANLRSDPSTYDIATTMEFTPVAQGSPVAPAYINELRAAINKVRTAATVATHNFGPDVQSGDVIYATDVTDLRDALPDAFVALGIEKNFADAIDAGTTTFKASHIIELQDAVK